MKKQILVVGGAGYIGSHTAMALHNAGYDVIVFDNLSTGHAEFLRFGQHVIGDLANPGDIDRVFSHNSISGVMHFAAFINVGESVVDPAKYYQNNISHTLNLLMSAKKHDVSNIIFSSTCAVYGTPLQLPLTEDHSFFPINPYGRTKLAVEWLLEDFSQAYGMKYTALRYFNASGAAPEEMKAHIGEWHTPETHLIPLILQAAHDPEKNITIFGDDYGTHDGTCIRDYIHVCDLADAHILAMERLMAGEKSAAFNLGNGQGYSVAEVIAHAEQITGKKIAVHKGPRRAGDPAVLVGDSSLAMQELGWQQKYADIHSIIKTAWQWEQHRMARQ